MKTKIYIAVLLAGMLALAGCGGGGSAQDGGDPPVTPPTYAEMQQDAIEKAATKEEVDTILEDLDTAQLDATEDRALTKAANDRKKAIDDDASAAQKETDRNNQNDALTSASTALTKAISDAQGAGNSVTQALIAAVTTARDTLQAAITAATEVDDTSKYADEVANATSDITSLETRLSEVTDLNAANTRLSNALTAADTAGEAVTEAMVTEIEAAHAALNTLIEAATLADTSTYRSAHAAAVGQLALVEANKRAGDRQVELDTAKQARETAQKGELTTADNALSGALTAALNADAEEVTEEMVTAITDARADLEEALRRAVDVSDEDKAQYQRNVEDSSLKLATVQQKREIAKAAEEARKATETLENAAKRADAKSLKAALDGFTFPTSGDGGDYPGGSKDTDNFGDGNKTSDSVSALHGWTGAKYQDKTGSKVNGEGYLYTKPGEEKKGLKFGSTAAVTEDDNDRDYEYQVSAVPNTTKFGITISVGVTTDTDGAPNNVASRISIDGFDITAGYKVYEAKDGETTVMIPGSYHGVPGDYRCTVSAGGDCRVNYNEKGQTFSTDAVDDSDTTGVVFIPDSAETQVTAEDTEPLAEYGWWLDKSDADDWTVNVFADRVVGNDLDVVANNALPDSGTAKYVGGAAGKYAFSSFLGDSHEAGHFTADVELNANFDDTPVPSISGTIDGFKVGDDGESRNWEVKLGESIIGDQPVTGGSFARTDLGDNEAGIIPGFQNDGVATDETGTAKISSASTTTWTIDGDAADPGGQWQGQLWEVESGVPTVATGTFRATYGSDATMVGAFGADKE